MKKLPAILFLMMILSSCALQTYQCEMSRVTLDISGKKFQRLRELISDERFVSMFLDGDNLNCTIGASSIGENIEFNNVPPGVYDITLASSRCGFFAVPGKFRINVNKKYENIKITDELNFFINSFPQKFTAEFENISPMQILFLKVSLVPLENGVESKIRKYFICVESMRKQNFEFEIPFLVEGFYNIKITSYIKGKKIIYPPRKIYVKNSEKPITVLCSKVLKIVSRKN